MRRLRRVALWAIALTAAAMAACIADGWSAFGTRAGGARLERATRSPQWRDGLFHNPQPMANDWWMATKGALHASVDVSPSGELPAMKVDVDALKTSPPTGLRVTWLGHSTTLLEIDGHRVLTDPVWSDRISPFSWIGPQRWAPPLIALDQLPPIDVVVISHDHYDHMDTRTLMAMKGWKGTTFVVPLTLGANLESWGIPASQIVELDWWERTKVGDLEVVATPARHASGRTLLDADTKLWAGYAFLGRQHRAYYSGDTGLFPRIGEIGEKLGPFDLTMIESGQYGQGWPDWHLGPEQAVKAHQLVRGKVLLPVHWGMFVLAYHAWTEPIERVLAAAASANVQVIAPRLGQSVEPALAPRFERWWPKLPWKTAAEDPIAATRMDER